jgi:eukaryotic-like serine/threonine-protein kinase
VRNEFLTHSEEIVDSTYRLGAVVGRSAAGTVYQTEFGPNALPAVIKIRDTDMAERALLVERWRGAIELSHPNLLQVYAVGPAMLNDVPVAYVVMERAEESLAGVLTDRALTENETREMLGPALAALKYLHKNSYAHTRLKPSNVLAVGDQLKLSSDGALRVQDGGAPAEDMRALGVLIVEALTRKAPQLDGDAGPYILRESSQAFTDIVRRCLDPDPDRRWNVEQVEARLEAPSGGPVLVEPRIHKDFRTQAATSQSPQRETLEEPEGDRPSRSTPKWVFLALAALVLIVLLVSVMRKRETAPPAVTPVPPIAQETAPDAASDPPGRQSNSPAPQTNVPGPAAPRLEAAPAPPRPRGRRADGWSVIVAAYGSREAAEKRMHDMARKFPKFNGTVFEQKADRARYLVVLGQNLSEDEAETLRKRAVGSGLPRDTYIKRVQ